MNTIKNQGIPTSLSKLRIFNSKARSTTLNMGLGLPEVDIPETIRKIIPLILDKYPMDYSPNAGDSNLREQIAKNYGAESKNMIITHGAQEALMSVLLSTLNPNSQDEILIPNPGFLAYPTMSKILQAKVRTYDLCLKHNQFSHSKQSILNNINTNTKVVLLNSPCNPTGRIVSEKEIKELAQELKSKNILLVIDEVYGELSYNLKYKPSFLLLDNIISVNSFSKSHALTGFRIGWCASLNDEIINNITITHQYITTCASRFSQNLMLEVFEQNKFDEVVENFRQSYEEKLDIFWSKLKKDVKVGLSKPQAGFYLFLKIPKEFKNSEEFCNYALEKKDILFIPGEYFGSLGKEFYRVSFSLSKSDLEKAADIINTFYN